jgi:murein DD-endopeptidase MepM/ murein hydrolase activator NlpD
VRAGAREFRGVPGLGGDPEVHVALFTLPYDEAPSEPILFAVDAAGNRRTTTVPVEFLPHREIRDKVELKDAFLQRKVPELDPKASSSDPEVLLQAFLKLNREGRQANEALIREKSREAEAGPPLFSGAFRQQPNSQVMAGFPQERDYQRGGDTVDTQWHLGLDLASSSSSPVPAANAGRVLFVGDNGLYGNMVLVDHGMRLVTLYAHLGSFEVTVGQQVEAGRSLGRSGMTGLAAGDHLHFAMLIDGVYTNPLDWFDPKYIADRIAKPLVDAGISLPGITDVTAGRKVEPAGGERRKPARRGRR